MALVTEAPTVSRQHPLGHPGCGPLNQEGLFVSPTSLRRSPCCRGSDENVRHASGPRAGRADTQAAGAPRPGRFCLPSPRVTPGTVWDSRGG